MLLTGGILLLGNSADLWIQIISVLIVDLKKPRHVVDTCDQLSTSLNFVFHSHSLKSFWEHTCTLWQRPTVRISVKRCI